MIKGIAYLCAAVMIASLGVAVLGGWKGILILWLVTVVILSIVFLGGSGILAINEYLENDKTNPTSKKAHKG